MPGDTVTLVIVGVVWFEGCEFIKLEPQPESQFNAPVHQSLFCAMALAGQLRQSIIIKATTIGQNVNFD